MYSRYPQKNGIKVVAIRLRVEFLCGDEIDISLNSVEANEYSTHTWSLQATNTQLLESLSITTQDTCLSQGQTHNNLNFTKYNR